MLVTHLKVFYEFTGNTFIFHICADFCQQIYQECSSAFSSTDPTQTSLTAGYDRPVNWCENQLVNLLPYLGNTALGVDVYIDAHGVDKSLCFSFAPVVHPFLALFVAVFGYWALSF